MSTRRTARVAAAIRQVVSTAILFELRDPRVANVTILHVEVPVDLRTAKVYVSIMGEKKDEVLCLQGLNSARGWLQSKIADELDLRYTPVLTFVADQGVKKSIEVSKSLRELHMEDEQEDEQEVQEDEQEDLTDEIGEEESPTD
ncbi:MAG: 30S ribosome-binding factor RbfA [Planctomycetaceae bacterium]|nr:30S ribosome-binding factor RbfA [Planctomycetaceae bacterium]